MKKAIDIVLLPPENIMDLSIKLNNQAFLDNKAVVKLDKKDFLPHISLLMGVIEEEKLSELIEKLKEILKNFDKVTIEIEKTGDNWISLTNTETLQKLHENTVQECDNFLTHDAKNENFLIERNEIITNDCYPWVNNFPTNHSFEKYQPHITIGNPLPY